MLHLDQMPCLSDANVKCCYKLAVFDITKIQKCAYAYFTKLNYLRICDGVEIIGESAFLGCHRLKRVQIADTVSEIARGAFFCCPAIQEVRMSRKVKYIGPVRKGGEQALERVSG